MNPVYGITKVHTSSDIKTIPENLPPVSKFKYFLHDISREDAGRTEDMTMHKNRIGQSVELELGWSYLTFEQAKAVLQAFNYDEYITIEYLDPTLGIYREAEFYVADREVPIYNHTLGLTGEFTISCISKKGDFLPYPKTNGGAG